jgi:uncharacterized protein (DUF849 family)
MAMSAVSHAVLLMVAPNGARRTRADHPALPLTPEEMAETAAACAREGAAALHLHVRDEQERHSLDPRHYRAALAAIERRAGGRICVQITTEAAGRYDRHAQMECVRALRPGAVSLALREILPGDAPRLREETHAFLLELGRQAISPQFILYAPSEVRRLARLHAEGVIPQRRPFLLFVLGRYGGPPGRPEDMGGWLEALGGLNCHWMVCAFGPAEAEVACAAATAGGHARIGFENNLLLPDGTLAPDNAALVAATRERLRARGHVLMPSAAAADLLAEAAEITA